YLIDNREMNVTIESLSLEWSSASKPLLTQISVFGSNDLTHWELLIDKQTVADLQHQGFQLKQQSLEMPSKRMNYYRIHWPPGKQGITLLKVMMQLQSEKIALPGQKEIVTAEIDAESDGNYYFNLDGHFPISGIRLQMPQRNTVVNLQLYSREDEGSPWQLRYKGLFYDLEREGHRLSSGPIYLPQINHPQWRLEVPQSNGGLGSGMPQLEMEWHAHRLTFVTRGEKPFTLAFGRQKTMEDVSRIDPLLQRINIEDQEPYIKTASTGRRFDLGGKARLHPVPPPLPWKKWILWLILVGGVIVLGLMTRSLYKQINRDNEQL
ncbi:MAG: DUF3999 domain-containing protein, partial [Gammaproteobacteria bacterium]|nr:DUF3999 domain-containing protein [Gammaproteobacteria bacterium]